MREVNLVFIHGDVSSEVVSFGFIKELGVDRALFKGLV